MRWASNVDRMDSSEMRTELWLKNLKETDHSEGLDIGGRIILKLILGNCVLKCSLDSSGSG
jgi:hypothetical protein